MPLHGCLPIFVVNVRRISSVSQSELLLLRTSTLADWCGFDPQLGSEAFLSDIGRSFGAAVLLHNLATVTAATAMLHSKEGAQGASMSIPFSTSDQDLCCWMEALITRATQVGGYLSTISYDVLTFRPADQGRS